MDDDDLAPMVDGLSGALCVFILITTVFMLSAADTFVAENAEAGFKFNNSYLDITNRKIEFNGGLRISHQDTYKVRQDIRSMKSPVMYVYIPTEVKNSNQKMVYNLALIKAKLDIDVPIKYKKGTYSKCGGLTSCIYWEEESSLKK